MKKETTVGNRESPVANKELHIGNRPFPNRVPKPPAKNPPKSGDRGESGKNVGIVRF